MRPKDPAPHSGSPEAELTHQRPPVGIVICNPEGEPGPIWRRAMEIDPEAFAAINTTRHTGTSARRILALDQAQADAIRAAIRESQSPEKTPERGGDGG